MLCQGKDIVACDLFEIGNQVTAKRFPCSQRVDLRKHRQQSSNLGAWPHLVLSAWRVRDRPIAISIPRAQPSVTAFAVSWPGENAERT